MRTINDDTLQKLYYERRTVSSIAKEFGCCIGTIMKRLKKINLHRERLVNIEDITGQRFGRLVALKYLRNDRFGKALWIVHCDCGKDKVINASGMKAGLVKSCGCYKRQKLSTGYESISGAYWRKLHKAAVQRGFKFTITMKEAWDIFVKQNQKCALSGVPISIYSNYDKAYLQTGSLDRIDSTIGYVTGNIQWIHKRVNFLKRNYPEDELVFWCTKIYNTCSNLYKELNSNSLIETRPLNKNTVNIKDEQLCK